VEEEPARGRRQVVIVEEPAEDDVHVQVVNDEIDIQQVRDEDRQIIIEEDDNYPATSPKKIEYEEETLNSSPIKEQPSPTKSEEIQE